MPSPLPATAIETRPRSRSGPTIAAAISLALTAAACADDEASGSGTSTAAASSSEPAATSASTIATPSPTVSKDLIYDDDSRRQKLDVYVPAGDGPFPTIVAFHGGGFYAGGKIDYRRHATYFADRGIAFVAAGYRYATSDPHPAQVEDAHCVMAWVHEHADEHGFDRTRIVAMGASAGGYIVGMLATVDDPQSFVEGCPAELPADHLAGAIPMYGLLDVRTLEDEEFPPGLVGDISRLAGVTYGELTADERTSMSPTAQIDGSEPPVLAIHGTGDLTIPSFSSERFIAALAAADVDAELLLVDAGHGFDVFQPRLEMAPTPEVLAAIEQFVADLG